MHSFITFTLFTALTAAVPIAHPKARHLAFPPLAGREVGIDGTCGSIWGGSTCAPGLCCSAEGYCGASDAYCGAGCQSPFGNCGSSSSSPAASSSVAAVSVAPSTSIAAPSAPAVPASSSAPAPVTSATSVTASAPSVVPVASSASTPALASPSANVSPSSNSNSGGSGSSSSSGSGSISGSSVGLGNKYTMYSGDGAASQGWPSTSEWVSFDELWSSNEQGMSESCAQWNVPNNSAAELADLKSAIQSVAQSSGIPAQFILAIVLQESAGCVRAPTTNYGVRNPGLMQDHDGTGTCNDGGSVQTPCPASQITQMIKDGTTGTAAGDGLQQCLQQAGATASGAQQYYMAARIYNSGSIPASLDLGAPGATRCYASNVANRLTGWSTAPTLCTLS